MKLFTSALVLLIGLQAVIAQQPTQLLKIKVKDEDNLNLPGASISVTPGKLVGTTNQSGEISFVDLKTGKYLLNVSYIGYTAYSQPIEIKSGATEINVTLQSGIKTEKEVIVLGDRLKGQSRALNQQKNNLNVSNIISADQIGRFPDANIGDAIKRIPGIAMQNDQGEARNIIIRGMGPELNSVSLNGERIPSAEGDNRRVQMDLIPSDMVQTVEVNKTLTPEMDADAIGGSVNLVSRAPSNGLRISTTLAGGYNVIREGFIGTAGFIVGNRVAKNKLGFVLSGSLNTNKYGSDNVEAVWQKDANGKLYIADHDVRKYDVKRVRRAASATIDYKINPKNTLYLTATYNWRDDLENRYRFRHRLRGGLTDLNYDAAGNITGYRNGEVLKQTKGGILNERSEGARLEDQRVRTLALRGEHVAGKVKIDWSTQYARASEMRPNERYISMGRRSITVTQDITDLNFPLLTATRVLTDYTRFNDLSEEFQVQYEEDINGKLNFQIPLSLMKEQKGSLRFGARIRAKIKERDNIFYSYRPRTTIASLGAIPGLSDQSVSNFYPGPKFFIGQFASADYLGGLDLNNPALYTKSAVGAEYLSGNYKANEIITAGYAQLNQQWSDRLSMVAGVRMEATNLDYTGNIVENENTLKGIANFKNNYVDFLPSINFRYQTDKNLILRLAYTTAIARPKYYDLVPFFNVVRSDLELSSGNPKLSPIRSTNLDLMAERYFKNVGLISGGVFYKRLSNFFYTYRDESYTQSKFATDFPGVANPIAAGENWQYLQRRNGSPVNVQGFEVAFQRQLDFLSGFWKGVGVYANYTFTNSKSEGIYDLSGKLIRENVSLPGTAPHMFNFSLSYESKKVVARISANFTGAYVDDSDDAGYNEDAFFDRYYDKQFFLDANASYAFTKKLRLFAEANNLTNQPLRYYQGVKERTAQIEFYGPRFNTGLKLDLTK
jgi:TonB-dependent receptor